VTSLASANIVFDNTANDLLARFNPSLPTGEFGDQINIIPGQGTFVTGFLFQYWGENFSGDEQARVRFYANDGPLFGGAATPGTLLYDSGAFPIAATVRSTLNFDLNTLTVENLAPGYVQGQPLVVPSSFTWTVQFSGVDPTINPLSPERAGTDIYTPPTVGSSYDDYWEKDPVNGWMTKTNQYFPQMNFNARVEAVPEPNAIALAAGGALLFALFRSGMRRQ
jgi:hypothetical protein